MVSTSAVRNIDNGQKNQFRSETSDRPIPPVLDRQDRAYSARETEHLKIVNGNDETKRARLAKDPSITVAAQRALSKSKNPFILSALVANPVLIEEVGEPVTETIRSLIKSGVLLSEAYLPAAMTIAKAHSSAVAATALKVDLAWLPEVPEHMKMALVTDHDVGVRRTVIRTGIHFGNQSSAVELKSITSERQIENRVLVASSTKHESVMDVITSPEKKSQNEIKLKLIFILKNPHITDRVIANLRAQNIPEINRTLNLRFGSSISGLARGIKIKK